MRQIGLAENLTKTASVVAQGDKPTTRSDLLLNFVTPSRRDGVADAKSQHK
jgi:hypothetical protein